MDKRYGYLCLMRPPMPGSVPRDGLISASFDEGVSARSGHRYCGTVVYGRELSAAEIEGYELEKTVLYEPSAGR